MLSSVQVREVRESEWLAVMVDIGYETWPNSKGCRLLTGLSSQDDRLILWWVISNGIILGEGWANECLTVYELLGSNSPVKHSSSSKLNH